MAGPPEHDIQVILERAAAGDENAWRELVETYTRRVYGLLHAQCGLSDLAEEITQSTFCTVAAKLSGYIEHGRFEAWLFRIAMNRLRDEMRRRKRQAATFEEQTLAGLTAGSAGLPGRAAERAPEHAEEAELAALRRNLARLSDADQRIIQLRHHAELSFKQIADVLGQPVGTVLARHHRALKKLRELMGGVADET